MRRVRGVSDEIRIDGMAVSPGVIDKIVTVAVESVDGVASLGPGGITGMARRAGGRDVEVTASEDGAIAVTVHLKVAYGRPIREVAAEVQVMVADAIRSQVGQDVERVDVYVDAIAFGEQERAARSHAGA
ncbi:MAG: Asp23/Gls24 family envelope stress response protein [Coriobacteriaceae bacterium]|nr:Asp23/Gls24 family envelope stress response protein [Coriobacteriaceae bacterium]